MAHFMVKDNKQTGRKSPPPKPYKPYKAGKTSVLSLEIQPQPKYVLINGVKYVKEVKL